MSIFSKLAEQQKYIVELMERDRAEEVEIEHKDSYSYDNGDNIDRQPSIFFDIARCPKCGTLAQHLINFCPDCGQRLKWGEKEHE